MSYQITFIPSEEKMETYKPYNNRPIDSLDSSVNYFKYELLHYCMTTEETSSNIIKHIVYLLKCLITAIEQEEKTNLYFRWKNNEKHEVWFCGWEFSRECTHDIDEILENCTENLMILASMVKTPNYFTEHDNFNIKYNDIKEDVEGFIELVQECVIHKFINDLKEFEVKGDEE